MTKALIIGSGPAAAGAALALSRENLEITVVDIGLRLEKERQQLVDILATSDPYQWDAPLVENISEQSVGSKTRGVPEKRLYGSDYPFRNVGQLDGAYGGDKYELTHSFPPPTAALVPSGDPS